MNNIKGIVVLIIFVIMAIIIIGKTITKSPLDGLKIVSPIKFPGLFLEQTSLKEAVDKSLIGTKGTYGIAIKNLKTNEDYYLNEHKVFESASLYKLWIMATAFNQIEKGKLKENEILKDDISKLNEEFNIASEDAEMTDGEITLSVKNTLEQMITISHNYASLLLSERIGLAAVKTFLKDHDFSESAIGQPPKTTPYDISFFFEKLYNGELANEKNTQEMLTLLKKQKLNNKLPKYLTNEISIAHKTGEIGYFTHDGGIVFSDKGDYIIVVMSESDMPPAAEDRIANISKNVYSYFTEK